ncbi:RICIN domain-containing protein [Streptomyces sp. NBC_00638]|uniref:RICIN domain-containing protein n=1 Tax=unclassified Streptomyces TaxID=2593676 RepID=UPI002256A0E7|nr:RICIN domain-containing protein [Streptomyces sp. NBC_00638]MCX5007918.1 RICIN domain-containing protein [Streptomyces sp. NBC_00638]
MRTPHPPLPAHPPGGVPGESDEGLAALLRGRAEGDTSRPVAVLTARHWQPTYDYAVICLATSGQVASTVAEASFHHVLGRLAEGEPALALRPQLLVTVRDTVKSWSADDRISSVLPDLRKPAGGRGLRAAKSMTAENRQVAERAFLALPGLARCLLWHTEVEAESLSVPAGLSGMDTDIAAAAWEQAREQFREGCVRAHRELAPSRECGFYNRLLDVPIRRGGALLPDVQQHLAVCSYCRHAAEQLSHFEGELGILIAESVLGWGARRYLDSRPGRAGQALRHRSVSPFGGKRQRGAGRPAKSARSGASGIPADGGRSASAGHRGTGGRHRLLSQLSSTGRRAAGSGDRPQQALLTGAGLSAALLATVLAVSLWPNEEGGADPATTTGASSNHTLAPEPGSGTQSPPAVSAPPESAALPANAARTRLRNLEADLCLDIRGAKLGEGAETRLAVCSSAWTQQWSYESDGLLRSVADPGLCLDSGGDNGVLFLSSCVAEGTKQGEDMRYDLTTRGELLLRRDDGLAVTPASTDPDTDVVVKVRDGSDTQRWRTDGSSARPDSLSIAGTSPASPRPTGEPSSADGTPASPSEPVEEPRAGVPADPGATSAGTYRGQPRAVAVGDGHRAEPGPLPVLPLPLPDVTGLPEAAGVTGTGEIIGGLGS